MKCQHLSTTPKTKEESKNKPKNLASAIKVIAKKEDDNQLIGNTNVDVIRRCAVSYLANFMFPA